MSPEAVVEHISEWFVKPQHIPEDLKSPHYLTPWDLAMLSMHYIQKGHLFAKPYSAAPVDHQLFINTLLHSLNSSLSLALVHFYPLAGRLATLQTENPPSYSVFVDCINSPGARFIHAKLDITVSDVVSSSCVPVVVQSLFDHDRALNHDGHNMSLLSVQVTELLDGIFIGCSMNHSVGDGTSFWNFFNMWSEIFRAQDTGPLSTISRPPIHTRWFPDGHGPVINLPFKHHDEFLDRYEAPQLVEKFFHFSAKSIAKLKAKANAEFKTDKISSFQSLAALMWRSITRVRGFPQDRVTSCKMVINNRTRLNPPLCADYFGNAIQILEGNATIGELLERDLGWAAWKLHQVVANHDDQKVRGFLETWIKSPVIYQLGGFDPCSVMMSSSPRFNMYGVDFGLGKALALRSGYANKIDGEVTSYPGYEGGGSIDLQVSLPMDSMRGLESDEEFMDVASLSAR